VTRLAKAGAAAPTLHDLPRPGARFDAPGLNFGGAGPITLAQSFRAIWPTPNDSEAPLKFAGALMAALLLAAAPFQINDLKNRTHANDPDVRRLDPLADQAVEPPSTTLAEGDRAPDFSYLSEEGRWLHLHDLLEAGGVLLAFAPSEEQLAVLQREREALLDLGIVPVAVLDRSARFARAVRTRLGLEYPIIPDMRGVVAGQFNVLSTATQHSAPAWFVVDRRGTVMGLGRGELPADGFPGLAAKAIGAPPPGAAVSTGGR